MSQHPQRRPGSSSRGPRATRASAAGAHAPASADRREAGPGLPAGRRPPGDRAGGVGDRRRPSGRPRRGAGRRPAGSLLPQSTLARQVAILGLVLCAIALSVAFPLRNYLEQRAELAARR